MASSSILGYTELLIYTRCFIMPAFLQETIQTALAMDVHQSVHVEISGTNLLQPVLTRNTTRCYSTVSNNNLIKNNSSSEFYSHLG